MFLISNQFGRKNITLWPDAYESWSEIRELFSLKFESCFLRNSTLFSLIVLRMRSKLVIADSWFVPGILAQLYICYRKIRLIRFRFERSFLSIVFGNWNVFELSVYFIFYTRHVPDVSFLLMQKSKKLYSKCFTLSVYMSSLVT